VSAEFAGGELREMPIQVRLDDAGVQNDPRDVWERHPEDHQISEVQHDARVLEDYAAKGEGQKDQLIGEEALSTEEAEPGLLAAIAPRDHAAEGEEHGDDGEDLREPREEGGERPGFRRSPTWAQYLRLEYDLPLNVRGNVCKGSLACP